MRLKTNKRTCTNIRTEEIKNVDLYPMGVRVDDVLELGVRGEDGGDGLGQPRARGKLLSAGDKPSWAHQYTSYTACSSKRQPVNANPANIECGVVSMIGPRTRTTCVLCTEKIPSKDNNNNTRSYTAVCQKETANK